MNKAPSKSAKNIGFIEGAFLGYGGKRPILPELNSGVEKETARYA